MRITNSSLTLVNLTQFQWNGKNINLKREPPSTLNSKNKMAKDFANAIPESLSTEIATQCLRLNSEIIQATSNQILL
jgi:hypothetical protein